MTRLEKRSHACQLQAGINCMFNHRSGPLDQFIEVGRGNVVSIADVPDRKRFGVLDVPVDVLRAVCSHVVVESGVLTQSRMSRLQPCPGYDATIFAAVADVKSNYDQSVGSAY